MRSASLGTFHCNVTIVAASSSADDLTHHQSSRVIHHANLATASECSADRVTWDAIDYMILQSNNPQKPPTAFSQSWP